MKEFRSTSDDRSFILIYGPVQHIQDARKKLHDLVARKCDTVAFSHHIICDLREEHVHQKYVFVSKSNRFYFILFLKVSVLKEKAQIYNVNLSFDSKKNIVTVQGLYAKQFRDKLLDLFERLSELLFVPTNIVSRWYYRQRSLESLKKFIQIDNDRLEKGFKEKKFQVSMTLSRWQSVEVYFDSMTLMSNGNLSECVFRNRPFGTFTGTFLVCSDSLVRSYQRVSLKRKDANGNAFSVRAS